MEEEELEAMEEDMEDGEPQQGEEGSVPWCQTLSLLMTIPVAHTTLPCCGGIMCKWPRRRLRARYLLMLNFL